MGARERARQGRQGAQAQRRPSWAKLTDEQTRALVRHRVRLAPGSDAHNVFLWDGVTRWFGNNEASFEMLKANGYADDRLWYFENRCSER